MTQTFIGFDSAWADKSPGAICSFAIDGDDFKFEPPRPVNFANATAFVRQAVQQSSFTLIAIDQPTIVPNLTGCRPVDRVVGSVVGKLKGGVQPARRGNAPLFGDGAPIWRFLKDIEALQDPPAARDAKHGTFLIEVFPALSLPSIAPLIWHRGRAAKYNPAKRSKYCQADWQLVAEAVAEFALALKTGSAAGMMELAAAARQMGDLPSPSKSQQDMLDSLVCLAIALDWRFGQRDMSALIGDGHNGYMVTTVTSQTRAVIARSCSTRRVPMDSAWD